MPKKTIEVGTRVQMSARWLRSVGCYTGEIPFLKGEVVSLKPLKGLDTSIAAVEWDDGETSRVNVANLHILGTLEPN